MKNLKIPFALVAAVAGLSMSATAAFAMPADIEEAVTSEGYDSTQHQNGTAAYDDSELIPIDETYVSTANVNVRTSPFGTIIAGTVPGQEVHVIGECPDCMWYKISVLSAATCTPATWFRRASTRRTRTATPIRA